MGSGPLIATREYARAEPVLRAAWAAVEKKRKAQPFFVAETQAALVDLEKHRTD